ncbi:GNAT family N-acetyltransferase [Rhodobacter sp. Har01]|uniref:GNAT family N-acetyltransferase n=1 Tax=Rhodobacter sp. Har01 TaxID=2883999 RepID=UPI001D06BC97|nr:GNAT family N-acetyltransferase [Rhodobacter sp. Har01]MCB6179903.1 GNAT family N-acetyltransferase [Rhodobacter sp. Har01]
MTVAPTLLTPRLRLRMPVLADFGPHADFHASSRSVHEGGPRSRAAAWRVWASDVALWLLRGYGPFGVENRDTGGYLGEVGVYQGADYPGPELGWFVVPAAEGTGVAHEATRAVLDWLRASFDWPWITSIIDPANSRSITLGLRLGGVIDPSLPGVDPGDVVIRHDLRGRAA